MNNTNNFTTAKAAHAHDTGFKAAMSDVRVAKDILRHHLPAEIQAKINLETLGLCSGTFVDPELQVLETDVLYSVEMNKDNKDNKDKDTQETLIYCLVEHQSKADPMLPWRMIKYCVRIINQHLKKTNTKILPLIIPLVVYNGDKIYPYSANIFDLFGENKVLAEKYMFKSFYLIDLNIISDEEIRQYEWSALLEMLLKHIRVRDIMLKLEEIKAIFQHLLNLEAQEYVLSMLKYLIERANIEDRALFLEWIKENFPQQLETTAMTLAEQWKNEGIEIGMQQGIQKAMTLAEQWKNEGIEIGVEQGAQKGALEGEKRVLIKQLKSRFGSISLVYQEKIDKADSETLLEFAEKILTAKIIDEVF